MSEERDCSGRNNNFFGKHHTQEARRKIGEHNWLRGTKNNPLHPMLGKKNKWGYHTEEYKQKMSLMNEGENNPNYGKHPSEETRKKMSVSHKGKNTWSKGRASKNKNKTYEEIYGMEGSIIQKQKLSLSQRGKHTERRGKKFDDFFGIEKSKIIRLKMSEIKVQNPIKSYNSRFKNGYYQSKSNGLVWYRSSYELAVMRYFDNDSIKWIYEGTQNRFYLQSTNKYFLNDFYLPDENKYIQVKGYPNSVDKFEMFKCEYPNLNIELWDEKILKNKGIL